MKVDIGGARLFFDVDGAELVTAGAWMHRRQTVVLLPDSADGADHSVFKRTMGPTLAKVAQVVYLDYRSTGRSDRSTTEPADVETCVDDVQRLCEALEIDGPIVLGCGFGVSVALRLAARQPELVLLSSGVNDLRGEAERLSCPTLVRAGEDGAGQQELADAVCDFVVGLAR